MTTSSVLESLVKIRIWFCSWGPNVISSIGPQESLVR
jgi:hypothetical protein